MEGLDVSEKKNSNDEDQIPQGRQSTATKATEEEDKEVEGGGEKAFGLSSSYGEGKKRGSVPKLEIALLTTSANILSAVLIFVVYANYLLLKPYISSFVAALLFNVCLRGITGTVKEWIVEYATEEEEEEEEGEGLEGGEREEEEEVIMEASEEDLTSTEELQSKSVGYWKRKKLQGEEENLLNDNAEGAASGVTEKATGSAKKKRRSVFNRRSLPASSAASPGSIRPGGKKSGELEENEEIGDENVKSCGSWPAAPINKAHMMGKEGPRVRERSHSIGPASAASIGDPIQQARRRLLLKGGKRRSMSNVMGSSIFQTYEEIGSHVTPRTQKFVKSLKEWVVTTIKDVSHDTKKNLYNASFGPSASSSTNENVSCSKVPFSEVEEEELVPSELYFKWLFQTCFIYLGFIFAFQWVGAYNLMIFLFFLVIVSVFVGGLYLGMKYSFKAFLKPVFRKLGKWDVYSRLDYKGALTKCIFFARLVYRALKLLYRGINNWKRKTMLENANVIAATIVICFIMTAVMLSSIFFAVQFTHETKEVLENVYIFVDQSVFDSEDANMDGTETIDEGDTGAAGLKRPRGMKNLILNRVKEAQGWAEEFLLRTLQIEYSDEFERHDILGAIFAKYESGTGTFNVPPSLAGSEETVGNATSGEPVEVTGSWLGWLYGSKHRAGQVNQLIAKEFEKKFPNSDILLKGMLNGEWKNLSYSLIVDSWSEIRNVFIELIKECFGVANEFDVYDMLSKASSTHGSSAVQYIVNFLVQFCSSAASWTVTVLVFLTSLFYLLCADRDVLYGVSKVFPLGPVYREKFSKAVSSTIKGVFLSSLKLCLFHGLFTWLSFNWAGVPFIYLFTFLSCFVALIPVFSPMWPSILAFIILGLRGYFFSGAFLALSHIAVLWTVYPAVYSEIPSSHPYVTGLSVVMGVIAFDWQGALYGPILICIPVILYELYIDYLRNNIHSISTPITGRSAAFSKTPSRVAETESAYNTPYAGGSNNVQMSSRKTKVEASRYSKIGRFPNSSSTGKPIPLE